MPSSGGVGLRDDGRVVGLGPVVRCAGIVLYGYVKTKKKKNKQKTESKWKTVLPRRTLVISVVKGLALTATAKHHTRPRGSQRERRARKPDGCDS